MLAKCRLHSLNIRYVFRCNCRVALIYQNVEDAQRAITLGRGMLINGRACRTEVARVNRELPCLHLLRMSMCRTNLLSCQVPCIFPRSMEVH